MVDITTTNGERFSLQDSANMAWLVYRRFGRDLIEAAAAWNRLLGNNCDVSQFEKLLSVCRACGFTRPYRQVSGAHVRPDNQQTCIGPTEELEP